MLLLCSPKWINGVLYRKWESIKFLYRWKLDLVMIQHVSSVAYIHDNDIRLEAIRQTHSVEM